MTQVPYSYRQPTSRRYIFTSIGAKRIDKIVDFVPLKAKNVVNLGFGDLMPDGSVNDMANSNNGDIIKVLATIVAILKQFTYTYPKIMVFFAGSTKDRTRLYTRILKVYFLSFTKEFVVYGIVGSENDNRAILFNPKLDIEYLGFLIQRID
jgi:hypothetical protein